jgi:hypothetical protein
MAQRRIFQASREEVSDLPVRGLSPANVVGGQYRVAVQQAPESGYTKLARSLSNVSAGLQAYAKAGETVSEMYEQELQGMTLDQIKAEQAKMQERLDGAVRKGKLPFLGNPMNWERNQKAIARRYAGLLHSQTVSQEGRFFGGKQDGDEKLSVGDILLQEREKFLRKNPELEQNPLMLQAFDADWTQRSDVLNQRFSDQKQKEFNQNIASDVASQLHELAKATPNLITEDSFAAIEEIWANTGNLNRRQQEAVITSTFKSLSKVDEYKAYQLLDAMTNRVKIGGQFLGHKDNSQMIDELKDLIGDVARNEMQEDGNRMDEERKKQNHRIQDESRKLFSNYVLMVQELNDVGTVEFNGEQYSSTEPLTVDFRRELRQRMSDSEDETMKIITAQVFQEIDEYTIGRGSVTQRNIFEAKTRVQDTIRIVDQTFSDLAQVSISEAIGKGINLSDSAEYELWSQRNNSTRQKISEEAFEYYQKQPGSEEERIEATKDFITNRTEQHTKTYLEQLKQIIKQEEQGKELIDEQQRYIEKAAEAKEPVKVRNLKGEQLFDALEVNYSIFTTGKNKTVNQQAVTEFWKWYDTEKVISILNGETPKVAATNIVIFGGGDDPSLQQTLPVPAVPYTEKELEKLERLYLKVQSAKGMYTELHNFKKIDGGEEDEDLYQVIVDGQANGYDVNVKELNPRIHRILTEEELLNTQSATAKRKAEILGVSIESLRKDQSELYEKNRKIYKMFER